MGCDGFRPDRLHRSRRPRRSLQVAPGGCLWPPYETAVLIWEWGIANEVAIQGTLLRNSGLRLGELDFQEAFAVSYVDLCEVAGGRGRAEEVLKEWAEQSGILTGSDDGDVSWADADRRALANLQGELN